MSNVNITAVYMEQFLVVLLVISNDLDRRINRSKAGNWYGTCEKNVACKI